MDHGLFGMVKAWLNRAGLYRRRPGQTHSDGAVLAVYFWAVLHRRPTVWACDRANWTPGAWRGTWPSQSCVSRRLREPRVIEQMDRLERAVRPPPESAALVAHVDGKALEIALHSGDAQSGVGRGVGHSARGYQLHAVVDAAGRLLTWRLAALDLDEREMARRMLGDLPPLGYLVADTFYDSTTLFAAAHDQQIQLVAPRRPDRRGRGLGHIRQHAARLRSIALLENPAAEFGRALLTSRRGIERFFAHLSNFAGGLTSPPPWVRTYRRVRTWVQANLILALLRRTIPTPPTNNDA